MPSPSSTASINTYIAQSFTLLNVDVDVYSAYLIGVCDEIISTMKQKSSDVDVDWEELTSVIDMICQVVEDPDEEKQKILDSMEADVKRLITLEALKLKEDKETSKILAEEERLEAVRQEIAVASLNEAEENAKKQAKEKEDLLIKKAKQDASNLDTSGMNAEQLRKIDMIKRYGYEVSDDEDEDESDDATERAGKGTQAPKKQAQAGAGGPEGSAGNRDRVKDFVNNKNDKKAAVQKDAMAKSKEGEKSAKASKEQKKEDRKNKAKKVERRG